MSTISFGKAKKIVGALALGISALGFSSFAAAQAIQDGDTLKLDWGYGSGNANSGGAFLATVLSGDALGESFLTFCLERNEYFTRNQTLTVDKVNTEAVNGGISGGNPDPLDAETAYLYTKFSTNSLIDDDGDFYGQIAVDAEDKANGEALQLAIWKFEGEWTDALGGQALLWYNEANTAVSSGAWSGIGQVRVLNLLKADGSRSQDQLYITPVPEPETYAMLLAGLGLLGFMARRRQKKDQAA